MSAKHRGRPEHVGRWVFQQINGVWYVFPAENTDDGCVYWGAVAISTDKTKLLEVFSPTRSILRDAMLALHEVLADLEAEYENTRHAAELCPSRRQRRGLEDLAAVYEKRLSSLRQFFDWDIYHDCAPAQTSEAA